MPNWVVNKIEFSGKQENIDKVLSLIKGDEDLFDFNQLIPMPARLNLTSGGNQNEAMMYALSKKEPAERDSIIAKFTTRQAFLYTSYFDKISKHVTKERIKNALEQFNSGNGPLATKRIYNNFGIKTFEDLGNAYINNMLEYGYDTWYDWSCAKWGTKWNACDVYMETENTLVFNTAWSAPLPVLDKLAELCYKNDVEFTGRWADEDAGCNVGVFESDCSYDDYWFSYDYIENQSNEAYEIYSELHGYNDCIGQDEDGNWTHYDCDDCPNKDCC